MTKQWEEQFDEKFVREDGLMSKYSYSTGEPQFMADAIKSFISNLIKQERESILPKLWNIRANIPLTDGKYARERIKQLIEELEND